MFLIEKNNVKKLVKNYEESLESRVENQAVNILF